MKRRDLIKLLKQAGFVLVSSSGGHDKYARGNEIEMVPRHRELNEMLAKAIIHRRNLERWMK
ncbi:MAG: type II toxin-antitoxin system HicA family toxin [Mogibacterium sp.]|nr:type II toxin-antitoxin system HicA family toxin [Mogibacterium sp.]MBR2539226.1 type II toxin-antitoxin system HicA family toxin [Mogibacterium sp.]